MKEFYSTTGGRHIYNADFKDLQDGINAATELFRSCGGDFVISGCDYDSENEKINSGYVWLNGKVRTVSETSVSTLTSLCIIPSDSNGESIDYADGTAHKRNNVYGTQITNLSATSGIVFDTNKGRFPNLADVFFNFYVLVKDGEPQVVNSSVSFGNQVGLSADGAELSDGSNTGTIYLDSDGNICLRATGNGESVVYKMSQNGIISAYNGENVLWSIDGNSGILSIHTLQVENIIAESAQIGELTGNTVNVSTAEISDTLVVNKVSVVNELTSVNGKVKANQLEGNNIKAANANVTSTLDCKALNVTGIANGAHGQCIYIKDEGTVYECDGSEDLIMALEHAYIGLPPVKNGCCITIYARSDVRLYPQSCDIYLWRNRIPAGSSYLIVSGDVISLCYSDDANAWILYNKFNLANL